MSTATAAVRVGDRSDTCPQIAADVLERDGLTVPPGSQSFGIVLAGLLTDPIPDAERTTLNWSVDNRITTVDRVQVTTVVTRVAVDGIERHIRLIDDAGQVRESGTETWRSATRVEPVPSLDFCSVEWAAALRDRLHADDAFTSSVSTWDGTIGLRCGAREVHLRVYKGRVIDVTRRTLLGATFTFEAPADTWVDLMLSVDDDFMRRALRGEFSSSGNGYEYLRLTKPLHAIIHHARAMAQEAHS
ncbi:hypothetical protein GDN83_16800 [Gordonia jinghuaiqii]|uniref:Uncharacterized protein n=1 Tax=Gordonia jinghuaiqii TaxID=2758710 RepID=A0A7D7QZH1_9ACTN|nr:hypothetical protein [Gordonia jinghuaiqii]MCR5979369.1 hypothetical protein [Gordonia jinghuaiqii]QMT01151.1 hypothetical protein H1R19_20210 [Gordonia jinghuaiqii]